MSEHHEFGGSRLPYLEDCRGFVSKKGGSTAASEGTLLHDVCEGAMGMYVEKEVDLDGVIPWANMYMDNLALDDFQKEAVFWCLNRVVDSIRPLQVTEILLEEKLTTREPNGAIVNFGSADIIIKYLRSDDKICALMDDYKFGRVKVKPAPINLQGHSYATSIFQMDQQVQDMCVRFLQPRVGYDTYNFINREELPEYYDKVVTIIDESRMANPMLTPNKACAYCQRAEDGTCVALANLSALAARGDTLPIPPTFDVDRLEEPTDVAKAYWCIKRVEAITDGLKSHATRLAAEGHDLSFIHGDHEVTFKLGWQSEKRELGDAALIAQELSNILTPQQVLGCCDLKISKIEELYCMYMVEQFQRDYAKAKEDLKGWKDYKKAAKKEKDGVTLAKCDQYIPELEARVASFKKNRVTKKSSKAALNFQLAAAGLIQQGDSKLPRLYMSTRSIINQIETSDE